MSDREPFNAIEEFKDEYRCITDDLRNAPSGQSSGPLEIDRPWNSYADAISPSWITRASGASW